MRIYGVKDKKGRVFAFEVKSIFIGRKGVCNVVKTIPNSRVIREPKRWLFAELYFCEFEVNGQRFEAMDLYGDGYSFWIGPKPPQYSEQIIKVREAFEKISFWQVLKFSFPWIG